MKRILSLLIAALMLCCTVYGAPSMVEAKEATPNTSKAEALTATRNIGGSKSMIRTMSKETAAKYESMGTKWDNVNDTYNEYDVAKLREFLEIEDEYGVKNGEKIVRIEGDYYDPDDPSTWSCLGWTPEGFLHHISFWAANFAEPDETGMYKPQDLLVGTLDVSGMQELIDVNIPENLLDGVIADNCPNLQWYYCGTNTEWQTTCSVVSAKNCPNLRYIGADCCMQENVSIEGCTSIEEIFMDYTPNLSQICLDDCRHSIEALGFLFGSLTSVDLSDMDSLYVTNFDYCPLETIVLSNNSSSFELSICDTNIEQIDLSECPLIFSLYVDNTPISELDLSNQQSLEILSCEGTNLKALDASNSPGLYYVWADAHRAKLGEINLKPYGNLLDITAENGTVGAALQLDYYNTGNPEFVGLYATPYSDQFTFAGWFDLSSGQMLNTEMAYLLNDEMISFIHKNSLSVVARFIPNAIPALPGDIDGNGEVTVSDAIMALRCAMGILELTPEQFAAADMSGEGEVTVSDAIMILRTAMGIN